MKRGNLFLVLGRSYTRVGREPLLPSQTNSDTYGHVNSLSETMQRHPGGYGYAVSKSSVGILALYKRFLSCSVGSMLPVLALVRGLALALGRGKSSPITAPFRFGAVGLRNCP